MVDVFLKDDGQRTGRLWGFVTMADQSQAQSALSELNGKMLQVTPPAEAQMPAAGGDMQMNQMNGAWAAGAATAACGGSGCGGTNWGYEEPPAMAGVAPPEVPAMAGVAPVAVMGQAQQAPEMTPAPHEQAVPMAAAAELQSAEVPQPSLDQQVPAAFETPAETPAVAPPAAEAEPPATEPAAVPAPTG